MWRTLTKEEWEYLVMQRAEATQKCATGNIEGIGGCILLPDAWEIPEGCTFTAGVGGGMADFSHNSYRYSQWSAMKAAGAVFLPAAGVRDGGKVDGVGTHGRYRSTTAANAEKAYSFGFNGSQVEIRTCSRSGGRSVRLVVDASTSPFPNETLEFQE